MCLGHESDHLHLPVELHAGQPAEMPGLLKMKPMPLRRFNTIPDCGGKLVLVTSGIAAGEYM
jgi:hypothetical protein